MSTGQCLSHTRALRHSRGATIPIGMSRWRGHAIGSGGKLSKSHVSAKNRVPLIPVEVSSRDGSSRRILTNLAVLHRSIYHVWRRRLVILRIAVMGLTCLNRKDLLMMQALCFRLDSLHLLWRMSRHASASCRVSLDLSKSHAFV